MQILFDHQIFCSQRYGGISRYFFELASRVSIGNDTTILCPLSVNAYLKNAPASLHVIGLQVAKLPFSTRAMRLANFVIAGGLSYPRATTDVLHETYFSSLRDKRVGGARVITVHDMIHEKFPEYFSRFDNTAMVKRRAVERADRIICVSEATRRDLIRYLNVNENKTAVVYHGSSFRSRQLKPPTKRKEQILYVGLRGGYKNFEGMAKAVASSPLLASFSLVCFGGGEFTMAERQLLFRHRLQARTKHVAGSDETLLTLLEESAALVCPSLYEGFGIPVLEAMATGCPVVCSNTSSLPEVVGNAAELFDPLCLDSIRHGIESVVLSASRAAELIASGHQRAAGFTWDACARQTLDVYRSA